MSEVISFLIKYKAIIAFYLAIIIWLYIKRSKLAFQAKFIILYRMKVGLKVMDKYAAKFRQWVILLGYIGMGAGFVGLVFISYILIKNLWDLIFVPQAVSGVSLVLPGINVPGLGVLPFWYWIIGIFVIAVVHEFSHGIVARAHNIEVKNTGLVFFGPIMGAFVEPDEKKLRKENDMAQYSVLAAGSFANILLAVVAIVLLSLIFTPWQQSMVEPAGFTFDAYVDENLPFAKAGIAPGEIITGINDVTVTNFQDFSQELIYHQPGEEIVVKTTEKEYEIVLAENPENARRSFLGIKSITNEIEVKERFQGGVLGGVYYSVNWVAGFLRWLFLLSLGIGLFNLLPLPIVDGGRMAQVFLHKLKGGEKGEKRYRQISLFFLLVLLLNLFFPLLIKLF